VILFWLILTWSCIIWYSVLTIYGGFKGYREIIKLVQVLRAQPLSNGEEEREAVEESHSSTRKL
jgi:hypothetical protein